jgi:hypothetical protein
MAALEQKAGGGSRHLAPIRVGADNSVSPLVRRRLGEAEGDGGRREAFVQSLVFDHPDVVPMLDIEPAFTPLVSVCTELATPAGYVDNVWVTPSGGLVLGECKLVRNPQARREVVAQALDYARAIAAWGYEDLEREVRRALKDPAASIWKLVEEATDLDEHQFVDAVERRLRTGRLMILIIGDGIQEGVEALTEHLQLHAGIHAGMALVDLSIWDDPAGGWLVVPRVPMRTVLIERGIVVADGSLGVRIAPPAATSSRASAAMAPTPRPVTASEPEFFAQLEERRPGLSAQLRGFLDSIADLGITGEYRVSCVLRWSAGPDVDGSAGFIEKTGKVWLSGALTNARRRGYPDAGLRYLETVAAEIGGSVRQYDSGARETVDGSGHAPDLTLMLQHADAWRSAIAALIEETMDVDA